MEKITPVSGCIAILLFLSSCASTAPPPEDAAITTIDTATAKEYFDRNVLFIDVRGDSYAEGHIPNSKNIYWNGEFNENTLAKAAHKDQQIVFYCDGPDCGLSIKASRAAVSWGYEKIYHFYEGYPAWKSAGYPVEE